MPQYYHVQGFNAKQPKVNILEQEAERKKSIPAPNKYNKCKNWRDENRADNLQKFLKSERITITDRILATKKLRIPGPSTYKPKMNFKVQ